jgi:outer membrane lipoprotein-sorting protein
MIGEKEVVMHGIGRKKGSVLSYLWFFVFVSINVSNAAQFVANMSETVDNVTRMNKLYVKNDKYRMEMEEEGHQVIVLVNQETGLTQVLMPGEKVYMEMANDDMQSLMNDPFQSAKYTEKRGEKVKTGTEKISGYDCDVYSIQSGKTELMRLWYSKKLDFPLKIALGGDQTHVMELSDIKMAEADEELFMMPAGYTKMGSREERVIELPDWVERVPLAKFVDLPFEQMMFDEEIVRVKTIVGKVIKIKGKNKLDDKSSFMAVPFKDGKPINDPTMYLYNMTWNGETWSTIFKQTPEEADEIVVRVAQGTIVLTIE